jgi:transcriptional adapter 3
MDITPDMTEEEKKEILCVAGYPESDLHDLTAGTPPDKDFSNAKPTNQVNFVTFQNYVEPFIRPLTEEERAFLQERGDRERPFVIPKLGPRPYKEVWAEEDGLDIPNSHSNRLPTNEPRGDVSELDDQVAETDEVSTGPLMARLLTVLRPELWRANGKDSGATLGDIDDMDIDGETNGHADKPPEPPATAFPEQNWKNIPPPARVEYASLEDRLLAEVKWLGLLPPNEMPDHSASMDDEVTARLRYLQSELKRQSIINGARKARLLVLLEDWQAKQEFSTIADDTDNQINAAYLKRNRNISKKGKQVKRPGGAGGGSHVVGVARPGSAVPSVGEPIRSLIERKKRWSEWIGPVVDYGKTKIPESTVFPPEIMEGLMAKEQESFNEEREF